MQRPGEADREEREAHDRMSGVRLRQPEPGIERRQQIDQRERVRGDDHQRGEAECEQGDGVAGDRLLDSSPAGAESGARGRRANRRAAAGRAPRGPPARAGRGRGRRGGVAARPPGTPRAWRRRRTAARRSPRREDGCAGCARQDRDERAAAGNGRRDRSCRSGTARAPSGARARSSSPARIALRVHVARRSLRKLEAGVERADEVLGRPAELAQARGVERVVLEDLRRGVRDGGERHCRDATGDERPLLSEGERKAEVEQLAECRTNAPARDRTARAPEPPRCARARRPANGPCRRRSAAAVSRRRRSRRG